MVETTVMGAVTERRRAEIAKAPGRCALCPDRIEEGDVVVEHEGTRARGQIHLRCKPLSMKGQTVVSRTVRRLERQWEAR